MRDLPAVRPKIGVTHVALNCGSRENNLYLWALMAPISYGQALIRDGKVANAMATLKAGIAA